MSGDELDGLSIGLPARRLVQLLDSLKEKGMSQAQVARRANLPPQFVSDLRNGRRPMSELTARRLGEEFNCSFLWLLGLEDSPERIVATAPPTSPPRSTERFLLPLVVEAIVGDPRAHPGWSGACAEVSGIGAAKAAAADRPYVLQLGHGDREGRLRKGDLLLISQVAAENAELSVVRYGKKILLARRKATTWLRVDSGEPLRRDVQAVAHGLGVIWSALI